MDNGDGNGRSWKMGIKKFSRSQHFGVVHFFA